MPIKLISTAKGPQTFNLICRSTRVRRNTFEHDPNTGQRHTRRGYVTMPGSLTLAKGARSKLLPDEAAKEDEIVGAKRAGLIKIIHVSIADAAVEKKTEAARDAKVEKRAEQKAAQDKKRDTVTTDAKPPKTATTPRGQGSAPQR